MKSIKSVKSIKIIKTILYVVLLCSFFLTACSNSNRADEAVTDARAGADDQQNGKRQKEEDNPVKDKAQENIQSGTYSKGENGSQIYTCGEMSVTIPKEWEGKYMVQESEDGFSFFQTASYEKAEGLGFLCGFYRASSMVDQSAGATQLAYTDDTMYYYQEPTDVNCYYEDNQIVKEYSAMMEKAWEMRDSLRVEKENIRYDAQEFEYPLSDKMLIPEGLLWNVDSNALWIARNEIYARHGRKFNSVFLQNYFESCSWYEATTEPAQFKEKSLSEVELENLDRIRTEEAKRKKENPYPKAYGMSKEVSLDLNGDGTVERIRCEYVENKDNWDYKVTICIDDMVYDLNQYFDEVYFLSPCTEHFYITDIRPSEPGYEIAVLDYGASEDLVTYFFSYDDELSYLGAVPGFPFRGEQGFDGFALEGVVMGLTRADIINTCYVYDYWYYDTENKKLQPQNTGGNMLLMNPDGGYVLNMDLPLYREMKTESDTITLKGQQKVFFLRTDAREWILVKGKDGVQGYMHCDNEHIDGMTESPQEIFQGLQFAD